MGFPLHFSLHTFPFRGEEVKNSMWVCWILIINPSITCFVRKLRFGVVTYRLEHFLYGLRVLGIFWGLACVLCAEGFCNYLHESLLWSRAFMLARSLLFVVKVQLFKTFEIVCAERLFGNFLFFYFFSFSCSGISWMDELFSSKN